jgi:hypothetical protein
MVGPVAKQAEAGIGLLLVQKALYAKRNSALDFILQQMYKTAGNET